MKLKLGNTSEFEWTDDKTNEKSFVKIQISTVAHDYQFKFKKVFS